MNILSDPCKAGGVLMLLASLLMLGACEQENTSTAQKHPDASTTNSITSKEVFSLVPGLSLPSQHTFLKASRKNEPEALVVEAYYQFSCSFDTLLQHIEQQKYTNIGRTEKGALFTRTKDGNGGGKEHWQLKIGLYQSNRDVQLGIKNLSKKIGIEPEEGTLLLRLFYRKRQNPRTANAGRD